MVRFKTKPQRSIKKEEILDGSPKHSILFVTIKKNDSEPKEIKEQLPKIIEKPNNDRTDDNKHPLEAFEGVPKLTDLQRMITSAILMHGEPCSFEKMAEFISQRWRGLKIRRRDGTPYATDYRRAIKANLRLNPGQVALFKRDPLEKDLWYLVRTIDEATSLSKNDPRTVSKKSPQIELDEDGVAIDGEMIDDDGLSDQAPTSNRSRSEDDVQFDNNAQRRESEQKMNNMPIMNVILATRETVAQATPSWGKRDAEEKKEEDYIELTELQTLVSAGINKVGLFATVDQIYEYVSPIWGSLKGPNKMPKTTDCRRAIITCLSKTSYLQLFVRNPTEYASWGLGSDHPWIKRLSPSIARNTNNNNSQNNMNNSSSNQFMDANRGNSYT